MDVEPAPLISAAQLRQELPNVQVLDVRPVNELRGPLPPIPGSMNVPIDQLEQGIGYTGFNKNKPLVTVCKKGLRSGCVVERLHRLGFTNVRSLDGGLQVWHGVKS